MTTLIDTIRESLATLTAAERRVAEQILDRPHAAITWSITELSRLAGVSDPSVIRFCRRMGSNGFPALKLELAHALARIQAEPEASREEEGDAAAAILERVLQRSTQALRDAHADLHPTALREAAILIAKAARIEIYGFGISGFLAHEAQYRIAALGLTASACSDPIIQAATAPLLGSRGVVVAFSYSGLTHYLQENVALAKRGGARIVTIAPAGSPIAALADVNLALNAYRKSEQLLISPSARIAFHVIMDALCTMLVDVREARD